MHTKNSLRFFSYPRRTMRGDPLVDVATNHPFECQRIVPIREYRWLLDQNGPRGTDGSGKRHVLRIAKLPATRAIGRSKRESGVRLHRATLTGEARKPGRVSIENDISDRRYLGRHPRTP